MVIRFMFKSVLDAEKAAKLLPVGVYWSVGQISPSDVFLDVPECYAGYLSYYSSNVTSAKRDHLTKGGVR